MRVTGTQVRAGLQLMVQVHAQFHPQYGFSWIVDDINPEFTMGDMARKRQEIIRQLKAEGVFDLQKELKIPMFAQHIAVISSASAAGYGDFCNQLADNEHGFVFTTELFEATMQGEQVERSIIQALNAINGREEEFDCVVIIRGGGATADLSGFDTLALAENVANFPLPIITGIGHERDESVLDMVSNRRVKTPTAAAAFLIDNLLSVLSLIEEAQTVVHRTVKNRILMEDMRIQRLSSQIPVLFSMVKTRHEAMLESLLASLEKGMMGLLADCNLRLEVLNGKIVPSVEWRLLQEKHRLEMLAQRAEGLNPGRMLKLGYSITYHKGHVLRNAASVKGGEELTTLLENGEIKSVVK